MNNFRLLNVVNPQFVYCNDCGQEKNNHKYMVVIPAFVGYDKNVACSIYVTINEKLLDLSDNNGLERLIRECNDDITVLLRGYDDFILGEDYFISLSLYDYIKTEPDDDDSSYDPGYDDSSDDSSDIGSSDDSSHDEYEIWEEWLHNYKGIIIFHGPDINRLMNIHRYNIRRISEIMRLEKREEVRRKKVLIMSRPDLSAYITDEQIDEIDQENERLYVMNDYVIYNNDLTFDQDKESYEYLFNINIKDMRNLEWFYHMNNLIDHDFTREELCNIAKTFFTIINDNAVVQNPETIKNQIYDAVVKYYANGGWDNATVMLNLLLNSSVPTTLTQMKINCGCNDPAQGNDALSTISNCVELYKSAITEWLKKMLSDDEFYKDWFFTILTNMCPYPNELMIDTLIRLLQEYVNLNLGDPTKFNPYKKYDIFNHINCCADNSGNDTYKTIILNYITVLEAVKNNEIDANKNMIKIYGEQFAEILPLLGCNC